MLTREDLQSGDEVVLSLRRTDEDREVEVEGRVQRVPDTRSEPAEVDVNHAGWDAVLVGFGGEGRPAGASVVSRGRERGGWTVEDVRSQ